jgi:D-beta-D-heptose 7-phosphate kinase/D-beta-D-heptose 1-phosphate adenosyltransferase
VGTDRESVELQGSLLERGVAVDWLIREDARPTTTKTRVIASHQQIVRVDEEDIAPISGEAEGRARAAIAERLESATAVVVSDYAKGFLTPSLLNVVIAEAGRAGKRVFIDPKGADYARYQGCFLMKPNRLELSILTGMPGAMILVTEGAEGMSLFAESRPVEHVVSAPRQVYDVTGAGDTVLATLSLAISAGASNRDAMELASEAGAIAVSTMGTAAVTLAQLEAAWNARVQPGTSTEK